jgi:hypothetical protein
MRAMGLQGAVRGKKFKTTIPDDSLARPADLVHREFSASRPNELWVADLERHEALSFRAVMREHRPRPSQRTG